MMSNQAKFFAALALCLLGSCGGGSVSTGGSPGVGGSAGGGDTPPTISVIAGKISVSKGFVDGQGAEARFNQPTSSVLDSHGSLFVADSANWAIRRVSPTGLVQTFVTLPAFVSRLAIDANDVIYALVGYPAEIYKIKPDGTYTIIGGGHPCSLWGSSTTPIPCFPEHKGFASDRTGNLYVLSPAGIHKVSSTGDTSQLVGATLNETYLNLGLLNIRMESFSGLVADGMGNLYTALSLAEHSILKIQPDGTVAWVVRGLPMAEISDISRTRAGEFFLLGQVTPPGADSQSWGSANVVKVTLDGGLIPVSGSAKIGAQDGAGPEAQFNRPSSITVDNTGTVWVTDTANNTLRKVEPSGQTTTLAGAAMSSGYRNGAAASALFSRPGAVLGGQNGALFVIDAGNSVVRKISTDGTVTTLAGSPPGAGATTTPGGGPTFSRLGSAAIDGLDNIYVADGFAIRRVSASGAVTNVAGTVNGPEMANDGIGDGARFANIGGMAIDRAGNLIVADDEVLSCRPREGCTTVHASALRKVTPAGVVTTLIGDTGVHGMTALCVDRSGIVHVLTYGLSDAGFSGSVLSRLDESGSTPKLVRYAFIEMPQNGNTPASMTCAGNGKVYIGFPGYEWSLSPSTTTALWVVESNGRVASMAGLALTHQAIKLGLSPWTVPYINGLYANGSALYFTTLNGVAAFSQLP